MTNNFSVGPSRLYHGVSDFYKTQIDENWGSISHRSSEFNQMSKKTIESLKGFFRIPDSYSVYYTYSATNALELSIRALVENNVHHIINGNFGNVWYKQSLHHQKEVTQQEAIPSCRIEPIDILPPSDSEMLCITANETSQGVCYSDTEIEAISRLFPNTLLAIDITSSMGACEYDFSNGDVWAFSVQKALGLPSGLGILILSPRAKKKAIESDNQKKHDTGGHHSMSELEKKMSEKFQTPTTPNTLAINALGFVTQSLKDKYKNIINLDNETQEKAKILYDFFDNHSVFTPSVKNVNARSQSIIVIEGEENEIKAQKQKLISHGIIVGNGYGLYKKSQMRIGNFPVQSINDIKNLLSLF